MEEYICADCGGGFEKPACYTEPGTGERQMLSPCCLAPFREGAHCETCGRLIPAGTGGLCSACRRKAVERFRLLLEEFTDREREAINEAYDGVALTAPTLRHERRYHERI